MAIENSRFKTRKEREEEEKKRKASEERFVLPTYEELNAIEEKAKEDAARVASSEKGLDFFQRPSNWDDGYQFGDVTKTALGTLGDVGVNAVKGVVRMGEGIGDAAQYGAAALADLFGADEKAEAIRQNAQRDKVTEAFSGVDEKLNKYSVLGRTSDAAAESLGQIGAVIGTAGLAGALGAGALGTTAATTGLMGLSSFGSGTGEAYAAGAEEGEAEAYGAIAGAADALSEMIFGGLGKGFKALGLSKGITSADDLLAKAVTSKIRNTLAKNTVQLGIKAGAEGLEEVLAGTMQAAGKKMTYMSESDFADIIKDENLLEQFVVGAMASGITQTPSLVAATRAGVDLVSDGADAASDSAQDEQDKFSELRGKNEDFGEIERTGLASGAKDEDIRMAGELSSVLGKKIRFFSEDAKNGTINNGEYHEDTGEIWINTRSKNVKAQIVAHELTHSIEKKDGYRQLVDLTMNKLEEEQKAKGKTLDDLYREKETLYADGGVRLASYDEITSELVAEYVEKRLLTDEASIKSLVSENRTLGQRIREWFDSLLVKLGNASAKEREYIRQMRDMYARALDGKTENNLKTEGVKHSFVGVNAEIDKSKLAVAERMEADGESKEDIRQKTGWFRSYDNKWRYEIDDSQAVWHLDTAEPDRKRLFAFGEKSYKLGDILEHDALYEAYPQLRDVEVYESPYASVDGYVVGRSTRAIALKKIDDRSMTKDMLLHELQHILQNIEGFATGASAAEYSDIQWGEKEWTALEKRNEAARKLYAVLRRHGESIPKSEIENNQVYGYLDPNDSIVSEHYLKLSTLADQNKRTKEIWDEYWEQVRILNRTTPQGQYHATAGEIEAYDTQARRRMTADERKAMRPNIDRDDAIVKFSVSRVDDQHYKDAIDRGDMETAQRMVNEVAEAKGWIPVTRYHQTGAEFTKFSNENPDAGLNDSDTPNGFFFKENDHDIGVGGDYVKTGHGGNIQMPVFLKMENVLSFKNRDDARSWYTKNVPGYKELMEKYEEYQAEYKRLDNENTGKMFEELEKLDESGEYTASKADAVMKKYDAVIDDWIEKTKDYETGLRSEMRKLLNDFFLNGNSEYDAIELEDDGHRYIDGKREDVHTYIVFKNTQIKSSKPVTYDDNGNVIPLSERFNQKNDDIRHSVSREDASVTEAETDQTLLQIRNDIAADEARYRELSDTVMSNERFNAMMPDEQNAILDEMQSLRERIDRANQIMQDMSNEQDMGDDVPVPGDENDPLTGVSSAVETEVEELDVNSAAYDGYEAQMPTDEDVYQSTAEQGMYDDMEAEYAELIRDKRKEDADKRTKQKAKDRRVEERLNRQYEDALTWRFGEQTPISEERLMEDARTVESMGEREFLREQGFGYRDMMDQMDEDAKKQNKEWRETQKRERAHLREVEDDLNRQFEQAEKERREINRRQREEDRKRRIERGEIQTVAQRLEENLRSAQLERSDIDQMRRNASEEYQMIIDDIQERYDALKNKNTAEANTLLRRISRTESRARTEDEAYQKRIYDIDEKIGRIQSEIQRKESPTEQRNMRRDLHESILYRIKEAFSKRGFDLDKVLAKAKDLSTFVTVDNTPPRVMEKSLGYKEGRILSDLTINQAARNETEGIRWLNRFTDRKDGVLAKLSKKYNIKPGSKESAAAQMYAEGFYVSDKKEIVKYGDRELAADFPDAQVRENIKGLAHDPIIRQIYDETLDAINASRTRNAFPEIQKLDNYYLHFRAMDDTFSRLGIPFNPNDIRAKDLPTDLNGVTADLKPGQPYFASANHRLGKRTSFDLLGGMEKYLTSAKNQIYHIDDIQTLRALRNYVADMYGQAEGLSNLDDLSDEEVEARIKDVYSSHLSTFAKFLNEEANVLAGKTSLIDRGLEGVIGRRGITFLNDVNRQVGANMVGYNISSSLTNFLAPVQAFAKMNKAAFVKGFAQTVENRMKSITGNGDDFAQKSDVIVRRKGADRFHRTAWQKMSDPGYLLMGMVDDISTEIIARAKYNELTAKGMDTETANRETDKWVSRLMGDRSLGQMPQIFNSKMLGLVTKFQLEVRNQLDSQFYDTIKEAQVQYEEIGDKAKRNAKTAAKVAATFVELALAQHVFGSVFESIAGYNPAFDIIEVIATVLGLDDDEESEDTALDNIEQGVLALIEDLPYSSVIMDGGRIPVSSAMPIGEIIKGQDEYGNDINRLKTVAEAVPYYALPGGYGQIKKTAKGLSMFSGDKEVTGSYTDSGNLRFPVEATPGNIAQAAVFGQWANENARDYFDNERKPANERQTMGYSESGLEWKEFQRYRDQISKLDRDADKLALIKSLDIDQTAKEALYRFLVGSAKKDDDGNIIGSSEDERLAALYATGLRFSDYADAKMKQAELNADEGLTANQRATRFYAWAASEGYTDEQADAITEQFKFSSGFKVEPTQYKKLIGGGVSPDNAVLVTDALSGASRAIDKINAVWSTGLTGKQLDNAVKAVVTEGWYKRYRKVIDANVPLDVLTWVLDNADANGNDSIDNEERTLVLSQLALSRKELSALWEATGGSEKSNPYSGNGGDKSGDIGVKIEMPKIEMPKIEMPKIELPKIGG